MDVLSYRPDPAEFAWTFGGVAPVRRVRPGGVLELWTEDAFGGRVRGPDDLVSRVVEFPFVNPQTGPFYVEGAEPGDTLAIHFVSIEPSRDWAASSTIPLFGSLTGTHATALLQAPLDEVVWMYEVDRARRTVTFRARRGDLTVELPLDPTHTAATWTPPRCGPGSPATWASTSRGRCSRSATATAGRARARAAGWPWRRPWTRWSPSTWSRGRPRPGRGWRATAT